MNLRTIAWNNLKRRKTRMIFLVAGLLIGVATVVTIVSLGQALTMEAQHRMENFGANIILAPKSDELSLSYGGIDLGGFSIAVSEIAEKDLDKIKEIPNARNIAAVAPKLLGSVSVQGSRVLLMGVDEEKEFHVKRWWTLEGRALESNDELVAGSQVAMTLGLSLGDVVPVNERRMTLVGILHETGSQDDDLLISTLDDAQAILDKPGLITMAEVAALCADCPLEDIVIQLTQALPNVKVTALQQVVKTRMHALNQFQTFSLGIAAVVVVIGALVVFVTMMGSVKERTREIGIFRALGFRRSHVMNLILTEVVAVSTLAGVLGYLIGMGVTSMVMPFFSQAQEGGHSVVHWDPMLGVGALALALVVGSLASYYPALQASRMDPTEALRTL